MRSNPTGTLGIVGVYMAPDPGAADEDAKQGRFPLPWGKVFDKVPLEETASAYRKFDERRDGYIQVILKPGQRPTARA